MQQRAGPVEFNLGIPTDANGHTDAGVAKAAVDAKSSMSETTKALMGYYEREIRQMGKNELDGAVHGRVISAKYGVTMHPQCNMICSRDIPATAFPGYRGVAQTEIKPCTDFLLGVCREHFKDRGVFVEVKESAKTVMEVVTMTTCIDVFIINTSITYRQVVARVGNTNQTIDFTNKDIRPVSMLAYLPRPKEEQLETSSRTNPMRISVSGHEPQNPSKVVAEKNIREKEKDAPSPVSSSVLVIPMDQTAEGQEASALLEQHFNSNPSTPTAASTSSIITTNTEPLEALRKEQEGLFPKSSPTKHALPPIPSTPPAAMDETGTTTNGKDTPKKKLDIMENVTFCLPRSQYDELEKQQNKQDEV